MSLGPYFEGPKNCLRTFFDLLLHNKEKKGQPSRNTRGHTSGQIHEHDLWLKLDCANMVTTQSLRSTPGT